MDNIKSLEEVLYEAKQQLFFDGDLSTSEEDEFTLKTPSGFNDPLIIGLIVKFIGLDARRVCKKWNQSWCDYISLDKKTYYNILFKEQKYLYTAQRFSIPSKNYIKFINNLNRREILRYITKPYLFNRRTFPYGCPTCRSWMTQTLSYDTYYNREKPTEKLKFDDKKSTENLKLDILCNVHRNLRELIIMSFKNSADCLRNVSYCSKCNNESKKFFKIQDYNRL